MNASSPAPDYELTIVCIGRPSDKSDSDFNQQTGVVEVENELIQVPAERIASVKPISALSQLLLKVRNKAPH
jgi:hypothetical protein